VIGTSAGSVVGALLTTGTTLADMYAAQLADPSGEIGAAFGRLTMLRYAALVLAPGGDTTKRRRLGQASLRAATKTGATHRRRSGCR
jgi:NTE family protein